MTTEELYHEARRLSARLALLRADGHAAPWALVGPLCAAVASLDLVPVPELGPGFLRSRDGRTFYSAAAL